MKRNLLMIASVLAALMLIFSCEKADENAIATAGIYEKENLTTTVSGVKINGGKVEISKTGQISFYNILNGYGLYDFNCKIKKEGDIYTFQHDYKDVGMNFQIAGIISDKKADIKVLSQSKALDLIKSWEGNVTNESLDMFSFKLENKSNKVMWQGKEISTDEFNENILTWLNLIGGMGLQGLKITFQENGFLSIQFTNPLDKQETSVENLARYNYNKAANLLIIDGSPLSIEEKNNTSELPITVLHIPFIPEIKGDKLSISIPYQVFKEFIPMIPTGEDLQKLLSVLDKLLPPDMAAFAPIIKALVNDIVTAITDEDVTNISIALKLQAVQE